MRIIYEELRLMTHEINMTCVIRADYKVEVRNMSGF